VNILDDNYKIFLGLYTALSRTKSSVRVLYFKILEAQKQYFLNLENDTEPETQEMTFELLDDAMHKFYLGSYALEQLWGIQNYLKVADHGLPNAFDSNLTNKQNEITFLFAAIFDQALYSWRSFLDYYLKYLLYFLIGDYQITMSTKKFKNSISNYVDENPKDEKVIETEMYIKEKVLSQTFGEEYSSWGDLLRSLRDKTAHQKLITPTISKQPNQIGYLITWPTIHGQSYSELAQQGMENPAFEMLRKLFPILYGFDWIPGPFKEGMFEKQ